MSRLLKARISRRDTVLIAWVLATSVLAGCATTASTEPRTDAVSEQLDSYIFEDGSIQHEVKDARVADYWRQSEEFRAAGDFNGARQKLQLAIQKAPRDPVLWSRAAEFELELKENLRAENYAAKSNFLTPRGNAGLQYRNWLLIERAREERGDLLGAREAQIESRKFSQ